MVLDDMPALKIERLHGVAGLGLLILEQANGGNNDCVAIHPLHVQHLAELLGLARRAEPRAMTTIATLTRRMKLLQYRINHLAEFLALYPVRRNADSNCKQDYATCTGQMAGAEQEFPRNPCSTLGGWRLYEYAPQCGTHQSTHRKSAQGLRTFCTSPAAIAKQHEGSARSGRKTWRNL